MNPATDSTQLYLRLLGYLRPHRTVFLWSLFGMVALGAVAWLLRRLQYVLH